MENATTVDRLRQLLDREEATAELAEIPSDTYVKLSDYALKLHAMSGPGSDDAIARLARKQLWLMNTMTKRVLQVRLSKARSTASPHPAKNLLAEERHIDDMFLRFERNQERFVKAVVDGQPSFFALAQRAEAERTMTVRISKRMGEIIGADLKRYGPFEVNDVAKIPLGNARAMVANRQAVPVSGDD
jgi:DNA replication initiation complex subunit (GINS family)